jgi:serine/threonine-protein kinase
MGEVYQAMDSRLGRSVAIKFLPEEFALDGERVARFQREARVLAALNHPNIASIHGLEESAGRHFLVMELVSGETLADRIQRGPVPLEEALSVARQIADALDSAHEKGIVHRDLKPSNIKITPDGKVKVLDFGLAKALESEPSNYNLTNSPTISGAATQLGVILGTAAYMSPEQARGKPVDRRADIWAFGVVLYEMVTGKRLFEGEAVSDTLAAVLERNVTLDAAPSKLRPLLKSCLERDPKKRLRDIGDSWRLVDLPFDESVTAASGRQSRGWLLPAALSVLLAAALVPAALYFLSTPEEAPEMRFESPAAGNNVPYVSTDGKRIAYVAPHDGNNVIWVRDIGALEPKPLSGTENADGASLFWSPDNQHLGFSAGNKLRKVDATSGVVQTLYEGVVIPLGGAWNSEGDVLFPRWLQTGRASCESHLEVAWPRR